MYPELHIGNLLTLDTYPTLGMAAAILAITVTGFNLIHMGISRKQTAVLLTATTIGFLAGARIFNGLTNPSVYVADPEALSGIYWGNFSLFGGMTGGLLTGVIAGRLLRKDVWALGDGAVYGAAPAILVAKLGCYGNGCCFGVTTGMPWGVTYPLGSIPSAYHMVKALPEGGLLALFTHPGGAVHPTQLYEGVGAVVCLAAAVLISRWLPASGSRFLVFTGGFSAVRLASWGLRVPPPGWGMGPEFYPFLYSAVITGSVLLLYIRNRSLRGGRK